MTNKLLLSSRNTHLNLRDRIRVALVADKRTEAAAAALAVATAEQLHELNAAWNVYRHLAGNREQYATHVASLRECKPTHFSTLASLANQTGDAEDRFRAARAAIYGSSDSVVVDDASVESTLKNYLARTKKNS